MALPGELDSPEVCPDCNASMPIGVKRSAAGYFLGQWCNRCGPYNRLTGYFKTQFEADLALDLWREGDRRWYPRDTDYHGG